MKKLLVSMAVTLLFIMPLSTNGTTVPQKVLDRVDRNVVRIIYSWVFHDIYGDSYTWSTQVGGVIIAPDKVLSVFHGALERPRGTYKALIWTGKKEEREWVTLTLIKHDRLKDLVLLQMDEPVLWQPIRLAHDIKWGEDILIAGFSMIPYPKIRFGRLVTRYFPKKDRTDILAMPSYFGDSGGGVFNDNGELVGIMSHSFSFFYKSSRQDPLASYAVALSEIREFLKAKEKKIKTSKEIRNKEFKKEFKDWVASPEIQKFFKEYKKNHPKGYKELIKFLMEQIDKK